MALFYKVIGLMSGTSMDGLDIVYCDLFEENGKWDFKIHSAQTFSYSFEWLERLNSARKLASDELASLSLSYGELLGELVSGFIKERNLRNIDFVASHGHTIHHQPEAGVTVQIGDGKVLAGILKIPVISNFRIQDVKLGGQGAPLVPIGDLLLFGKFSACLNLGGFSNISYQKEDKRVAFDIGPANMILNYVALSLGFKYDMNGEIAKSGTIDVNLLNKLNALPYYSKKEPKSLGIEWVENNVYPIVNNDLKAANVMRTFVEHIAFQISVVMDEKQLENVLVTGGGAWNSFLMSELNAKVKGEIIIPDSLTVEFKEALVFAFLGVLRWENRVNVLWSVTGSKRDHSSGEIHFP
jgi:anhydro-N-acetylmuramic acid kinase